MNKFFPVHLHVLWLRKHAFDHQEVAANFTKNGHKLWCKILDEERRNKRQMTRDKKRYGKNLQSGTNGRPLATGRWQNEIGDPYVIYPHPFTTHHSPSRFS